MEAAPTVAAGRRKRVADARREQTVTMLHERGTLSPGELAAHFGVSVMTVHRDLNELQRRGVIRKSHGGVTAQPAEVFESTIAYRETHMVDAKRAVAATAAGLVGGASTVVLDESTTVAHLVPHLAALAPLTVATNALATLRPLAAVDGLTLVALGGEYDPLTDAFGGVICERDLAALQVDVAFVSAAGVSDGAAHHADPGVVAVKAAMLASARRRYLLVDHTKLGRRALHEVVRLSELDAVVVDAGADPEALDEVRAGGVEVLVAGG